MVTILFTKITSSCKCQIQNTLDCTKRAKQTFSSNSFQLWVAIVTLFVFSCFPFIPFALDVIFPTDKPHKRIYLQQPNYFVIDDMKYYYVLFLFHCSPVIVTMTMAGVAVDSMVAASIMHVCGLFAIVWYVVIIFWCDHGKSLRWIHFYSFTLHFYISRSNFPLELGN